MREKKQRWEFIEENKKVRKQEVDQESDLENKKKERKQDLDQGGDQEDKKKERKQELDQESEKGKNFLFFLITFLVDFLFSYFLVYFYKFPPLNQRRPEEPLMEYSNILIDSSNINQSMFIQIFRCCPCESQAVCSSFSSPSPASSSPPCRP